MSKQPGDAKERVNNPKSEIVVSCLFSITHISAYWSRSYILYPCISPYRTTKLQQQCHYRVTAWLRIANPKLSEHRKYKTIWKFLNSMILSWSPHNTGQSRWGCSAGTSTVRNAHFLRKGNPSGYWGSGRSRNNSENANSWNPTWQG